MKPQVERSAWLWFAAWLTGLLLAALMAGWLHHDNVAQQQVRFDEVSQQLHVEIQSRMKRYAYGLRGARGLIIGAGAENVTRERFKQYSTSRDLELEFPGAKGFGFIRRVPASEEAEFLLHAQQDGFPDFQIRKIEPHTSDMYVIQYVEPQDTNLPAIGLDIASETHRRQAAELSRDLNEPVLTGPITLVQSEGRVLQSVLLLLPIYHPNAPTNTVEQRRQAVLGWAYAPLELQEVLKGLAEPNGPISLTLTDAAAPAGKDVLHGSKVLLTQATVKHTKRMSLTIFGREWGLQVNADQTFVQQLNQRNPIALFLILAVGSSSVLLSWALLRQGTRQRRQISVQQERMAAIVASSSDAVIGKTLEGVVTDWNAAAEHIFGYPAREAIGRKLSDLIIPMDFLNQEWDILSRVSAGESITGFDTVRHRKDGSLLNVTVSVSPIRDADGQVIGIAKLVRDITERKAAEAQILHLNQTLAMQVQERGVQLEMATAREQILINNAQSAVIVTDASGTVRLFNPAAENLLGYRSDEVIGSAVMSQFHDPQEVRSRVKALSKRLGRALEPGEIFRPEFRSVAGDNNEWIYVRSDGTKVPVLLRVGELRDERGELGGFIGISSDLTERKQLEQELQMATQLAMRTLQAEAANEAKSLFLANMSHEIRTPLNALIGLTYLLERTDLTASQKDFVQKMKLAGKGLLAVINDVLDLSRIEAGEMTLDSQPVCVPALMQDMVDLMQAPAHHKGLALRLDMPAQMPRAVMGDAVRLQQMLMNLLGNAIKFTSQGEVRLEVRLTETETENVKLDIVVRDTGIGIPDELQPLLFKPFSQVDASSTRRSGGTGLGLYIVRCLAELMEGHVALISSQPGQGSAFGITLKLLRADDGICTSLSPREESPQPNGTLRLAGLRILLVDDSAINRQVGQQVLELDGARVTLAANGLQALQSLRKDPSFDLVLMDLQMPEMDGFTAVRHIRQELGLSELPVIALTAGALQSERDTALVSGMNDYMAKPIDPDRVVQTILLYTKAVTREVQNQVSDAICTTEPLHWPNLPGIQVHAVKSRLGGNAIFFKKLLDGFAVEYTTTSALQEVWGVPNDMSEVISLRKRLHRLQGSAATLGMMDLAATALAVQHAVPMEKPTGQDTLQPLLSELVVQLSDMLQAISSIGPVSQSIDNTTPVTYQPTTAPDLKFLLALLRDKQFSALDEFERMRETLKATVALEAMLNLEQAMQRLDFEAAALILSAIDLAPEQWSS
jgi:PAS domain S-box-containing protein